MCCQVAYHGVPEKSYEVFVNALQSTFLNQGVSIPPLEDHNPAGKTRVLVYWRYRYFKPDVDVIMDMLGDWKMRTILYKYYEDSGEFGLVRRAVDEAWSKEQHIYQEEVDACGSTSLGKLKQLRYNI